jgi:hypothetical protein
VEALVPVTGVVRVEGQPLTAGWITFYPDEAHGNQRSHLSVAQIQTDGTYALTTNGHRGAPPGWYKVVVASSPDPIPLKPPRNPDGTPRNLRWLMHEKYTRPETTDLRVKVDDQTEPGRYDLHLVR